MPQGPLRLAPIENSTLTILRVCRFFNQLDSLAEKVRPCPIHGQATAEAWPNHGEGISWTRHGHANDGQATGPGPRGQPLRQYLTKKQHAWRETKTNLSTSAISWTSRKMRDVRSINFAAESRRDVYYVLEKIV